MYTIYTFKHTHKKCFKRKIIKLWFVFISFYVYFFLPRSPCKGWNLASLSFWPHSLVTWLRPDAKAVHTYAALGLEEFSSNQSPLYKVFHGSLLQFLKNVPKWWLHTLMKNTMPHSSLWLQNWSLVLCVHPQHHTFQEEQQQSHQSFQSQNNVAWKRQNYPGRKTEATAPWAAILTYSPLLPRLERVSLSMGWQACGSRKVRGHCFPGHAAHSWRCPHLSPC